MSEQNTNRPVILWDCDGDAEQLNHSDKNDAIEAALCGSNRWNGTITVYGFARMVVPKPSEEDAETLVDEVFEGRWEEYIGEDGPALTDRMNEAALQFLTVLQEEFVPWACEQVTFEEVDIVEWIARKRPDWVKERSTNPISPE